MKKYGKYERMPDGTRAKQPAVKGVLLQTYLTSLLSMVLCVTMFLGTTFAWFTSGVTSNANEIYVGMLDMGLFKMKDGTAVSLDSEDSNEKLFDGSICWEPGYTAIETIQIKNEGDLSFRYALTFKDGAINGQSVEGNEEARVQMRKVAENFVVYVHPGEYAEGEAVPSSFTDIEDSDLWRPVRMGKDPATLADILEKGFPVLSGNVEDEEEIDTYIIALHMLETTGEGTTEEESINLSKELMGQRISLNVKLTAYQRTHEADAFDAGYDLQAHVTDLGALTVPYKRFEDFGNTPSDKTIDLDAAYQFQPVESSEEGQLSPYKKYIADFVVTADQPVALNSIALAGYYELFCKDFNADDWIVLESDSTDVITPEMEVRLVGSMGDRLDITYEMLCDFGNDGIGFLCGIKNKSAENIGKTITVELRLYETQLDDEGHYQIADENVYIVAGKEVYPIQ